MALPKDKVFALLAEHGVARVAVEFYGGNDSGSVENITFFDSAGGQVPGPEMPDSRYGDDFEKDYELVKTPGGWSEYRLRADAPVGIHLRESLEQPVYDEYGSFAGDFSVSGTVTWDVAARTTTMSRSEQVWTELEDLSF